MEIRTDCKFVVRIKQETVWRPGAQHLVNSSYIITIITKTSCGLARRIGLAAVEKHCIWLASKCLGGKMDSYTLRRVTRINFIFLFIFSKIRRITLHGFQSTGTWERALVPSLLAATYKTFGFSEPQLLSWKMGLDAYFARFFKELMRQGRWSFSYSIWCIARVPQMLACLPPPQLWASAPCS